MPGIIRFLRYSPIAESRTIADQIRTCRRLCGLSQKGLAGLLKLDPGTIANWERDRREPRGRHLEKVQTFLKSIPSL